MRRKDREMDETFALALIDRADFGVLSVNDLESPMSVPLSIVRDGEDLYFHSAREGRKVELFKEGTLATIVFVGHVEVPNLYSEEILEKSAQDESQFYKLISSVFTTEFESTIVTGPLFEVTADVDKEQALRLICQKYTPDKMRFFDLAIQSGMHRTRIYRLRIEHVSAKRKKYAKYGRELKFMARDED